MRITNDFLTYAAKQHAISLNAQSRLVLEYTGLLMVVVYVIITF